MADPRAALAEIQARADAATEGLWVAHGNGVHVGSECVAIAYHSAKYANAEFTAAARTDVPRLAKALADVLDLAESNSGLWTFEIRNLIAAALAGES